jgi:hypothetical protein
MKFSRFLVFVCLISACSANDESTPSTNNASNNTSNNSTTNASNNASNNATNGSNNLTNNATNNTTQPCDTCAAAEVCFEDACCAPQTECAADQCGMVTDGCGLTIDCGICGCFNDNFTEFCPTRPCEVATSCNIDRECVYEAVTCGGSACECAGATCTDTEVRDCRDPNALICPADFCDLSPTMVNGAVVYQNSCVQPDGAVCTATNTCAEAACSGATCAESPCGLCNLGAWECAPNTTDSTCYDIPASALDIAQTDCDDTAATSTFIYLDHITGTDDMTSGSRSAPFLTFDAAMVAAKARGAKGVVVRSGLILTTTVQVENGISIYGGYSGTPDWKYDGGVLDIDVSTADANGIVLWSPRRSCRRSGAAKRERRRRKRFDWNRRCRRRQGGGWRRRWRGRTLSSARRPRSQCRLSSCQRRWGWLWRSDWNRLRSEWWRVGSRNVWRAGRCCGYER